MDDVLVLMRRTAIVDAIRAMIPEDMIWDMARITRGEYGNDAANAIGQLTPTKRNGNEPLPDIVVIDHNPPAYHGLCLAAGGPWATACAYLQRSRSQSGKPYVRRYFVMPYTMDKKASRRRGRITYKYIDLSDLTE